MASLTPQLILSHQPIAAPGLDFADEEGAEATFLGAVRGSENGQAITGIDYTAYEPMAMKLLVAACEQATSEHGPHRVLIQHRLGFVAACEPSILIRVWTRHSALAFDLCRWYLHRVKTTVPIWKRIVLAVDGSTHSASAV
jgi:molybdopterin synthase catalytic subunit